MMEREILASRVDMLESLLGSGTRNIVGSAMTSSETVILERLGVLETTTENIKTQLKEITRERQGGARLNTALMEAWKIHKLGFSSLIEDIKKGVSDNNNIFHNLLTDIDKTMKTFEFKFEELLNKSNDDGNKQKNVVEERFDKISSVLNKTLVVYESRMDTKLMVFINKTEKQLYDIRAEIITDECASSPCLNGATCLGGVRRYSCICMDGYLGTNCQTEINECASNPCMNGATCVDAIDDYSCRCQAGYMYAGNTCQIQIDECSSNPCVNGATCVDGLDNYSCRCVAGYSGIYCQIDIDDCGSSPCMNGATCVDGLESYSCRCVPGYSGSNCQIEINECESSPCKNGVTCIDKLTSYTCNCTGEWAGVLCDKDCKNTSSDLYCNCVDECPGGLDEVICECEHGYSNDFVTIPRKVIAVLNILSQTVSSAVECQRLCINTKGCLSCELDKPSNTCWINHESPITQPSAYLDDPRYDFFARKCLCSH